MLSNPYGKTPEKISGRDLRVKIGSVAVNRHRHDPAFLSHERLFFFYCLLAGIRVLPLEDNRTIDRFLRTKLGHNISRLITL